MHLIIDEYLLIHDRQFPVAEPTTLTLAATGNQYGTRNMATVDEMKKAMLTGEAKILTISRVKELAGKRIGTIYFNFHPQHHPEVDEFVVGEMKSEFELHPDKKLVRKQFKNKPHLLKKMQATLEILTCEGRRTSLRAIAMNSGIFTGPDPDYEVWFREY
jgi:hypothetical protein